MGADGGICWIPLRKPTKENFERVSHLLSPFYFFTEDCGADWQQDANSEWHSKNDLPYPVYFIGTYGSFQDYDLRWTLSEILSDEEFYYNPEITFGDLDLDFKTRPYWTWHWNKTLFEKMTGDMMKYRSSNEDRFSPISDMKLIDWWNELRLLLNYQAAGSEETWT